MKYEVGDKIRIVKKGPRWNSAGKMDHLVGKTVVIADIVKYSELPIGIRDEPEAEGTDKMWWLLENEIELVEKASLMKYKVGDMVRIVRKTSGKWNLEGLMDHMLGKTAKITSIDARSTSLPIEIRDGNDGRTWWFDPNEIELVDEPRFKTVDLSDPCERKWFMKKMETEAFKSKHIVVAKIPAYGEINYYILKDVDLKCSSPINPDYAFMSLQNSFRIWEDPGELGDLISRTRSDIDKLYVLDSLSDLKQLLIDEGV